jgi:hypothetical protein
MFSAVLQRVVSVLGVSARPQVPQCPETDGSVRAGSQFTLCAEGSYSAYAVFPDHGETVSAVANPGGCVSMVLATEDKVTADIWGLDLFGMFYVGSLIFGDEGADVATRGTREDPSLIVL